jgi:predicted DNA-binding transcriptional regulator AlpA
MPKQSRQLQKTSKRGPPSDASVIVESDTPPDVTLIREIARLKAELLAVSAGVENVHRVARALPMALVNFDALPDEAYVGVRIVAAVCGYSVSTVWRHSSAGLLPMPEKRGGTTRWRVGPLRRALASASR